MKLQGSYHVRIIPQGSNEIGVENTPNKPRISCASEEVLNDWKVGMWASVGSDLGR